jgi:3-hydroxybutyryl-CoA dehydratase
MNVRESVEEVTEPLSRTQIVRFAGACGDFNPMHHDEVFARDAGEPSVFAMGQLPAAILGDFVARWLGRDAVRAYGVRFTGKVRPGDSLVLRGRVTGCASGVRECALEVARHPDGEVLLTGWARAHD